MTDIDNNQKQRTAIECVGLCKRYGDIPAVCGADLSVSEGRFLALLGPSGCGKTTVLRLIAGLEVPDRGEVRVGAQTVAGPGINVPPEERKVGMVFQEYALFPHLNIEDNAAYGLSAYERSQGKRAHEVLSLVGLEGVKDRMPHELSGGQQQRVALARALAPRPDVILLDEPFSNLDAGMRVRLRAEVRRILRKAQVTAVFVTHDQEEALSLADEIAVMIDNRIVQTDTPERLYRRPESHMVATFLGDANFLPGRARNGAVECELGTLPMAQGTEGDVEIMFRPEDLVLTSDEKGPGVIIEREYFGHDQLLRVRMDSNTILKSRLVGCCRGLREGERVRVKVDSPVIAYPSPYGCPAEVSPLE